MGEEMPTQARKVRKSGPFIPDFTIRVNDDPTVRSEERTRITDADLAYRMALKGDKLRTKQAIALLISKRALQIDMTTPFRDTNPIVPVIRRKRQNTWNEEFSEMLPKLPKKRSEPIYDLNLTLDVANDIYVKSNIVPITRYRLDQSADCEALTVAEQADKLAVDYGALASTEEDAAAREYTRRNEIIDDHIRRREEVVGRLSYLGN